MRRIEVLLGIALIISQAALTQVQVSEEPRHHKVFSNDWVRILDVHIPPGDTSLWHKHSTPSVFLILSNTKTGSQVKVEPGKPSFTDGHIWFEGFYDTPRIHRVWNEDDHEFHVIDMELPHTPNRAIDPRFADSAFHLLFNEKPVRGYRLELTAGKAVKEQPRKAPVVVVCIEDGVNVNVQDATLHKKGDNVFIPAGKVLDFRNNGEMNAKLAVFELK